MLRNCNGEFRCRRFIPAMFLGLWQVYSPAQSADYSLWPTLIGD